MKPTKTVRLALTVCLTLSILFTAIFPMPIAAAMIVPSVQYPITGEFGMNHTYSISRSGLMTITGSGPMVSTPAMNKFPIAVSLGGYLHRFRDIVLKIEISEGTTSVGDKAFPDYDLLKEVQLPSTIEFISRNAFENCRSLTKINLCEGLTKIEECAFQYCASLTYVKLPSTLTEIGFRAFYACGLTSVKLPNRVTSIGLSAFAYCKNLADVSYGPALDDVGEDAFAETLWLKNRPKGVVRINSNVCAYSGVPSNGHITVPKGITKLADGCFKGIKELSSVTLPSSLKTIGARAFYQCAKLNSITLPDGLKEIGEEAFAECAGLERILVPSSVKTIGREAFRKSGLRELRLSKGLASIGNDAFGECINLKRAVIPEGALFNSLFVFCDNMEEVDFPGTITVCPKSLVTGAKHLKLLVFNEGTLCIKSYCISDCSEIDEIYLPASIQTIEDTAFSRVVKHIYYAGTQEQWNEVTVKEPNFGIKDAEITFNTPYPYDKTLCDVNQSGSVTTTDARLALRRALDLEDFTPGSPMFLACDADRNNKNTTGDARLILRVAIGLEDVRTW